MIGLAQCVHVYLATLRFQWVLERNYKIRSSQSMPTIKDTTIISLVDNSLRVTITRLIDSIQVCCIGQYITIDICEILVTIRFSFRLTSSLKVSAYTLIKMFSRSWEHRYIHL